MPYAAHHRSTSNATTLPERQAFHHAHSSLGATGHWIKTAGILAPLVIGEFVKDTEERWRYIRLASVATALVSEGMYAQKISRERQEARERALTCHSPG
jgi:hypothetical protein